jgi:hypothetical protein
VSDSAATSHSSLKRYLYNIMFSTKYEKHTRVKACLPWRELEAIATITRIEIRYSVYKDDEAKTVARSKPSMGEISNTSIDISINTVLQSAPRAQACISTDMQELIYQL